MQNLRSKSDCSQRLTHPPGPRRGGFIYVIVLSLTMLVFIMAMSAMTVARREITLVGGSSDWQEAQQLAQTAIENGIAEINADPDWRLNFINNAANPTNAGRVLGNGRFVWKLVDTDTKLFDSDTDPVRVYGIGYVRDTVYATSVLVRPTGAALNCLQTSLHAGGALDFDFGTITSNQTISTNTSASAANGATVNAKVQAVGSIGGATYNGVNVVGYPARDIPDAASLFDYYKSNGEQISITSLPLVGDDRFLEEIVLSPATNPFGATNSDGVYIIDCDGDSLIIRNCRIVGTLVLVNLGGGGRIEQSISMEPAIDYFPTLLVDGDFELSFTQTELAESSFAVNFNPPATPFPYIEGSGNNADSDFSDTYPSRITGLVYVESDLEMPNNSPTIHGCVVTGGNFEVQSASVTLKYRETWLNFPPPGFTVGDTMDISAGTWRREVP